MKRQSLVTRALNHPYYLLLLGIKELYELICEIKMAITSESIIKTLASGGVLSSLIDFVIMAIVIYLLYNLLGVLKTYKFEIEQYEKTISNLSTEIINNKTEFDRFRLIVRHTQYAQSKVAYLQHLSSNDGERILDKDELLVKKMKEEYETALDLLTNMKISESDAHRMEKKMGITAKELMATEFTTADVHKIIADYYGFDYKIFK